MTSFYPHNFRLSLWTSLPLEAVVAYGCGFVAAYCAFLVDRKFAIKALRKGNTAPGGAIATVRSPHMTRNDHRDALLAASIWPGLVLVTLAGPLFVVGWRYLDR